MIATLHSDRLVLRPLTMHDAPAIQRHFGTWHVIQHLSAQVPWPYPDDGAESFLRDVLLPAVRAGRVMAWGIALRNAPHEVIGMIEYRQGDTVTDNRGFWLSAEHQGRGYMTEAIVAFQDHIFFDLDVERIYVHNAVSNTASRRVKEKTGAVLVGMSQISHQSGETDAQKWVVTRERWAELRGR